MLDMMGDTVKLVFENKIFKNPGWAYRQVAIGAIGTAALLVLFSYTSVPLWVGAMIAGLAGGYAMPYLFKDVKFK